MSFGFFFPGVRGGGVYIKVLVGHSLGGLYVVVLVCRIVVDGRAGVSKYSRWDIVSVWTGTSLNGVRMYSPVPVCFGVLGQVRVALIAGGHVYFSVRFFGREVVFLVRYYGRCLCFRTLALPGYVLLGFLRPGRLVYGAFVGRRRGV